MSLSKPLRQKISELMAHNTQKCLAMDITIASHWYGLAALQGDSIAKKHLQRLAQPNTLL